MISIHAPTRGATTQEYGYIPGDKISIHAPTRGATIVSEVSRWRPLFQSTLPREERRSTLNGSTTDNISIHAPTRGATAILHKKFVYFYTIPTINI